MQEKEPPQENGAIWPPSPKEVLPSVQPQANSPQAIGLIAATLGWVSLSGSMLWVVLFMMLAFAGIIHYEDRWAQRVDFLYRGLYVISFVCGIFGWRTRVGKAGMVICVLIFLEWLSSMSKPFS